MTSAELTAWRKARNLTQQALADITGISIRQLKRYEKGFQAIHPLLALYTIEHPAKGNENDPQI